MTNAADRLLKASTNARMNKLQPKPDKIPAYLGLTNKTIRVPGRDHYVYCRRLNGEIVEVFNNVMPANRAGLPVWIEKQRHWFLIGPRDVYEEPVFTGLPDGVTASMTFPGENSPFIAWQQYLPGLVQPTTGLNLRVFGWTIDVPGSGVVDIPTAVIDMTSHIPASGALWARIESGAAGFVVTEGTPVTDISLLALSDIPAATAAHKSNAAVKLYAGQVGFAYYNELGVSDVLDLRSDGEALSAPSSFTGDADSVVVTDGAGALDTNAGILYSATDKALTLGDGPAISTGITGLFQQIFSGGSALHLLFSFGTAVSSIFEGVFARGTKASPTAALENDMLVRFGGAGYDGVTDLDALGLSGYISVAANENFSATDKGTRLDFWATPNGAVDPETVMTVRGDGCPDIGAGKTYNANGSPHGHDVYILHSLATAANDFLVASGAGVFVKNTLAEVKTLLGLVDWTAYSPSWTATGTAPSLGSGELTGKHFKIGKLTIFKVHLKWAADTTGGTGAWLFSTPATAADTTSYSEPGGAVLNDSSVGQIIAQVIKLNSTTVYLQTDAAPNGVGQGTDFTWTTNDSLELMCMIETA